MGKYKSGRPEAIIFDLDGTLIDSGLDIALSASFTRVHFGLSDLTVDITRSYVGDGVAKLLERVLGHDSATGRTGPGTGPGTGPMRPERAEGLRIPPRCSP